MTRTKARTTIPKDFSVSPEIVESAKKNGWPNPHSQIEAFKDYHLAHGSLMADWEAAFRTWLRNQAKWRAESQPSDEPPARSGVWARKL